MSLPRVALVASSFAPHVGGVEMVTARLAAEQRRRGADTIVVTNRYPRELPAHETVDGVPVWRERFRFPEPRPRHLAGWVAGTRATRRSLAATLVEQRTEILHVHCVSTNGYYALRAARRLRLPLVVSLHGELTMDADGIYRRSSLMRRTWRALLDEAAVVSGCSAHVVDEAVAVYGDSIRSRIRVVPNGVDVDAVRSAVPAHRPRPYLLAVGRLVPQKGFDLLLGAFAEIAADLPEVDLVIAGDGPERPALTALAAQLGDRVEFAGSLPPGRVHELLRGADGFVLSSRHEPQGIVVLEAMAAGTPVLATRVGGVPETVTDAVNGLLVDGGSVGALVTGMRGLLADPAAARRRAERAARDVEASTWERVADHYAASYADAVRAESRPQQLS